MRRTSNLAVNTRFSQRTGVLFPAPGSAVRFARDWDNPVDRDAVGIYLPDVPVPLGWLYRKDANRRTVLEALDAGKPVDGRLIFAGSVARPKVEFWL
ncbi:hypothetical protein [Acidithiobacillus caldus]|uniref:hypothetical protein n=1 Tax=Acidithiobacillus caldus TaxID=33059 RepID=UPI000A6B3CD1|nr:hypothetical protein [Acidithiobacillus caldus]